MIEFSSFGANERVLVVERGATVGRAILAWLRGWGMTAELATTVAAAESLLAASVFDLVVADAGLTGLDVGHLPIVTLLPSGSPPPSGRFVVRPVQAAALRAAIAATLAPPAGIDLAAIDALWGGSDSPAFRRVAQAFLVEAEQRIAAIVAACAADDRAVLEREAHSLAGAAVNVGAKALTTLSRELEMTAAMAKPAVLADRAETLRIAGAGDLAELRMIVHDKG